MSTIEYETHFALWCLVKAPLMLGTDLTKMSKDSESYKIISNKHLIAINQDPLGKIQVHSSIFTNDLFYFFVKKHILFEELCGNKIIVKLQCIFVCIF